MVTLVRLGLRAKLLVHFLPTEVYPDTVGVSGLDHLKRGTGSTDALEIERRSREHLDLVSSSSITREMHQPTWDTALAGLELTRSWP